MRWSSCAQRVWPWMAGIAALIALSISVSGCACLDRWSLPSPTWCPSPKPSPLELPTKPFAETAPLELDLGLEIPLASPVGIDDDDSLRLLNPQQCQSRAASITPTARMLSSAAEDGCQADCSPMISFAKNSQAEFERSEAAAQALSAYYRLASVYLQHGMCQVAQAEIDRLDNVLGRLVDAGLANDWDRGALRQSRSDALEQEAQLRYSQSALTAQLTALLDLQASDMPLWTDFQVTPSLTSDGLQSEIESAWGTRGDLLALQAIRGVSPQELLQSGPSLVGATQPLLGGSQFAKLGRLQRLFCRNQQAIANEHAKLQDNLETMIEAKRTAIAAEVSEAWHSIELRQQLLALKQSALADLDTNWQDRLRAKDISPIQFQDEVKYSQQRIELYSELLRERIELEIDLVRLQKAQGTLGKL